MLLVPNRMFRGTAAVSKTKWIQIFEHCSAAMARRSRPPGELLAFTPANPPKPPLNVDAEPKTGVALASCAYWSLHIAHLLSSCVTAKLLNSWMGICGCRRNVPCSMQSTRSFRIGSCRTPSENGEHE